MEKISREEMDIVRLLGLWNREAITKIKDSDKCFGDKVRAIIKARITDNAVYARKLIESD